MTTVIAVQMVPQGLIVPQHLFQNWGEIEMIKEDDAIVIRPKQTPAVAALGEHPAFGLWADRQDIIDAVTFATTLRQHLEERDDVRREE